MPKWINGFHLAKIYRGHDVDHVGDHATRMFETQNPKLRRMRPGGDRDIKDWNEILSRRKNNREPDPGKNRRRFQRILQSDQCKVGRILSNRVKQLGKSTPIQIENNTVWCPFHALKRLPELLSGVIRVPSPRPKNNHNGQKKRDYQPNF